MNKAERRNALNAMLDRVEAATGPETDRLSRVKAIVAATLEFPGTTEETKIAILTEMENGGYEALLRMFMNKKIPADFDPKNRPWNRS